MLVYPDYVPVAVFLAIGIMFPFAAMGIAWVFRRNNPYKEKYTTYECGEEPIGQAQTQFDIYYYMFAILFVVFDVEVVLIFPWALVFPEIGMLAVFEMIVFILVVGLGLVYAWKKGFLEWRTWEEEIQISRRWAEYE